MSTIQGRGRKTKQIGQLVFDPDAKFSTGYEGDHDVPALQIFAGAISDGSHHGTNVEDIIGLRGDGWHTEEHEVVQNGAQE